MHLAQPERRGFSLIEMLMVLFIIAVVLSLMLPAIQSGRAAAHRAQCLNNLKQIVLALQNYEVTHGCLPPGVVNETRPIRNEPNGYHVSWIVQLLPFMEQSYMYAVLDLEASIYDDANRTVRVTQISTFLCPDQPGGKIKRAWGISSYAACYHDVEAPIDVDNHGAMFLNSRTRLDDFLDGASNTILVGEKRSEGLPNDLGWGSGTRATLRNTGSRINATPVGAPATAGVAPAQGSDADVLQTGGFGSFHAPGGAHFAFGDGSARWISETVDQKILRLLGHRADGEVIDHSEF